MASIDLDNLENVNQGRELGIPEFRSNTGNADRAAILEENRKRREGLLPGATNFGNGGGWGKCVLQIPEFDWPFITRMFPDLVSTDNEIADKALDKFLASPMSEPYRVYPTKRKDGV